MLSQKDLAIARAHAEHQDDDLMLGLLDHIAGLQKMLDQARTSKGKPAPAPRRQKDAGTRGKWYQDVGHPDTVPKRDQNNATTKPKRPAWYPKEEPRVSA
jgi:hypothetical protein